MRVVSLDQIRGMFVGIAAGDALGKPLENVPPETKNEKYGRVTTYVRPDGHKWFDGQEAGTWTDDTQYSLINADSLICHEGFEVWDIALRHNEYLQREGDLGSGPTTKEANKKLALGIHHSQSGISDNPKHGRGNGVAMKVAPFGAFRVSPFVKNLKFAKEYFDYRLQDLTLMTHYTNMALQSAFAHVVAIGFCLEWDGNKRTFTDDFISVITKAAEQAPTIQEKFPIQDSLLERFKTFRHIPFQVIIDEDLIERFGGGTSYVYNSLPFAYSFFLRDPFDIDTLFDVINAGGDTDTNGSMVGGLLGALNGLSIFPRHLVDGLWQKERILATADKFYETFFEDKGGNNV